MWLWVPVDHSAIRLVRVGTRYMSRVLMGRVCRVCVCVCVWDPITPFFTPLLQVLGRGQPPK